MTTPTLEHVQAEHARLGEMISKLLASAQAIAQTRMLVLPEAQIELHPGEHYAGLVLDADGMPSHHLVLLPGEAEDVTWQDAKDWAAKAAGELPTRQEQALLYANAKAQFKPAWYWSGEEYEGTGSSAWYQYFDDGNQYYVGKSYEGRARAVRRFAA